MKNSDRFLPKHPDGLIAICGDFNPPSTGLSAQVVKRSTGLSQIVTVLTRDTGTLDWVLTNKASLFYPPSQLPKIGRSDHYAVLIKPDTTHVNCKTDKKYIIRRDLRESSLCALGRWLTNFSWESVLNLPTAKDKTEAFYNTLIRAIDTPMPTQKVKVCSSDKPWVSSRMKALVSRRQWAFKTHGKASAVFKMYRNKVQKEVRNCKRSYYSSKVSSLKETNISKWWTEVKALGGLSVRSEWWHQLIDCATPTIYALCEKFNEFLDSLTSHFSPLAPEDYATEAPVPPEFRVTNQQAFIALRATKAKKSPGPDPIPSRVWKEFADEMSPVVAELYNSSLEEGYVHDRFKTSIVTPAPKISPPRELKEDLRPITLTSPLAKIHEGFTLDLLAAEVLDKLDIKQFSVSGKSTTHALVYMLHIILEVLDTGNNFIRIFFADFSKGFDLVDHHSLLAELRALDIHPVIIRWICAFLSNRPQRVKIGSSLSPPVHPNGGIPQGTKLAPMLFAILVNRLADQWPARLKYVDDTTVFEVVPRCSTSYLQFAVNDIRSFASDKGMRLNPKKCRELVINFLQYLPASPGMLHIDGSPVRRVETYKILGVHLSSDLTWNVHIEYIVRKASKRLYALRSLKKAGVQPSDLVGIYCALIRSVLEYAAPVWSGLPVYLTEVLEAVQRRAMRIIFPYADYNTALCSAGLGSLADRRDAICAKFISNARTSPPLSYILTNRCTIEHGYLLRSGQQRYEQVKGHTERFNNFVTVRFQ